MNSDVLLRDDEGKTTEVSTMFNATTGSLNASFDGLLVVVHRVSNELPLSDKVAYQLRQGCAEYSNQFSADVQFLLLKNQV